MITNKNNLFEELNGLQLSSVEFVQDYFQICFDGPCITVYNPTTVESENVNAKSWDSQFRNLICDQIGKIVRKAEVLEKDSLIIEFEDKSRIVVSLKDQDYRGPEAINYQSLKTKQLVVI